MEVHVRLKNAFPGWIHGGIGYFSNERRFSVESSLQRISSNLWLWNRNDLSVELYCFGTSIGGSGRTNTLFPSDHELLNEKRKDRGLKTWFFLHESLFVSPSRQLKDHSGALDKETRSIKQPSRNHARKSASSLPRGSDHYQSHTPSCLPPLLTRNKIYLTAWFL